MNFARSIIALLLLAPLVVGMIVFGLVHVVLSWLHLGAGEMYGWFGSRLEALAGWIGVEVDE